VETRRALIERLEELGVTGEAALAIALETGPERHAARVELVVETARTAAVELGAGSDRDRDLLAGLLCGLDSYGIGGRLGVGGDGTARIPQFATLGKGRKRASDGPAWTAAIAAAGRFLAGVGGHDLRVGPRGPDVIAVAGRCRLDEVGWEDRETTVAVDALDRLGLAPWLVTLASEGLRTSLGLPSWFPRHTYRPDWLWRARPDGATPAEWAGLVNRLVAGRTSDELGSLAHTGEPGEGAR